MVAATFIQTVTAEPTATNFVRMPRRKFEAIRNSIGSQLLARAEYYLELSDAYEGAGMTHCADLAMNNAGKLNEQAYKVAAMSRREFASYMERIETRRRVQAQTLEASKAEVKVQRFGWVATIARLIVGK